MRRNLHTWRSRLFDGTVTFLGRDIRKRFVWAAIGVLCAVALVVTGTCAAVSASPWDTSAKGKDGTSLSAKASERYSLDVGTKAGGWDKKSSSPVIVHVVNEKREVDFYHAYDANEAHGVDVPGDGGYTVSFLPPLNADGSTYKVPAASVVRAQTKARLGTNKRKLDFKFDKKADVTGDELTELLRQVSKAVKGGDKTLSGANGAKVVERVEANAKANPNADAGSMDAVGDEAEQAARQNASPAQQNGGNAGTDGKKTGSTGKATGGAKGNQGGNASGTAVKRPSGNSSNGGSSSHTGGSSSGTSRPSRPSHTHTWVAQYRTVNHPAQYKTVNHPAQYKTVNHPAVYSERSICNNCGKDITGHTTEHMRESLLSGGHCGSYRSERVQTQAAWSEQVLVSNAWSEQVQVSAPWTQKVVTGYRCSGCGATK